MVKQRYFLLLSGVGMMAIAFLVDNKYIPSVSQGLLYLPLIVLTLFQTEVYFTIIAGVLAVFFVGLGHFLDSGNDAFAGIADHLLSLFSIGITVLLVFLFKQTKATSEFYKENLSVIFKHSNEGIIMLEEGAEIIMINPRAVAMFGYNANEIIGKPLHLLLPFIKSQNGNEAFEIFNADELASLAEKALVVEARKKDLTYFPVNVHSLNFSIGGKNYFVFFFLDVSDSMKQKQDLDQAHRDLLDYSDALKKTNSDLEVRVVNRTEDLTNSIAEIAFTNEKLQQEIMNKESALTALKESRTMMETIAENFPNGIVSVLNREYILVYAHGQEIETIGLQKEDLIGKLFLPLRNIAVAHEIRLILEKAFLGDKISFEYQNPGNGYYYLFNGSPLFDDHRKVSQLLIVSQNITRLKTAEMEMRKSLEQERELNELKSRFVSTASHEFRTPLATILSSASLISMYNGVDEGPKRLKHVGRIAASVNNLIEILNDFLSLGKIEEGKVQSQPKWFNVADLCEDVREDIGLMLKQDQFISIELDLDYDEVFLDKQLLRNVMLNLLSNAVKYSNEGSEVTFRLALKENKFTCEICDQGIGIPVVDQKHLFETFFRASNVENIKGTGMGLHIVKKYIDIMNGQISFKSDQEKGSCFTVVFNV